MSITFATDTARPHTMDPHAGVAVAPRGVAAPAAPRLLKIDVEPAVLPAAVRFARADSAGDRRAIPDLAASRRASLRAAHRLLNAELSGSDLALDVALDRMIDAVVRARGR